MNKFFLSASLAALIAAGGFGSSTAMAGQSYDNVMKQVLEFKEKQKDAKKKLIERIKELEAANRILQAEQAKVQLAKSDQLIEAAKEQAKTPEGETHALATVQAATAAAAAAGVLATPGVDKEKQDQAVNNAENVEKIAEEVKAAPQAEAVQKLAEATEQTKATVEHAEATIKNDEQKILAVAAPTAEAEKIATVAPAEVKKEDVQAVVETAKADVQAAVQHQEEGKGKKNPDLAKLKKMAEKLMAAITALQDSNKPEDKAAVVANAAALAPVTVAMTATANGSDNAAKMVAHAETALNLAAKAADAKTPEAATKVAEEVQKVAVEVAATSPVAAG